MEDPIVADSPSSDARPGAASRLAFHLSRIVIDVGVLMAVGSLSLPFITSPSGDRSAIDADVLPAVLLLVPVFLITLIPDHVRPVPKPFGWLSLVLGATALPYAVVQRIDAVLLADTIGGEIGAGFTLLVTATVVVLAGIVYGLIRAAFGIQTGGSATRTKRVPRGSVAPADADEPVPAAAATAVLDADDVPVDDDASKPTSGAKPEATRGAKPEPTRGAKPEPTRGAKPEPTRGAKPEPKTAPEPRPEPASEVTSEPTSESAPKAAPEPATEKTSPTAEPSAPSGAPVDAAPQPVKAEAAPPVAPMPTDPEPDPVSEPEPEAEPEPERRPLAEPVTGSEAPAGPAAEDETPPIIAPRTRRPVLEPPAAVVDEAPVVPGPPDDDPDLVQIDLELADIPQIEATGEVDEITED